MAICLIIYFTWIVYYRKNHSIFCCYVDGKFYEFNYDFYDKISKTYSNSFINNSSYYYDLVYLRYNGDIKFEDGNLILVISDFYNNGTTYGYKALKTNVYEASFIVKPSSINVYYMDDINEDVLRKVNDINEFSDILNC